MVLRGRVQSGLRHFSRRMTLYADVFARVAGVRLFPGTINLKVEREVPIGEDFRILGGEIGEPEQDLLFEECRLNGIRAWRIRPWQPATGLGGHGDDVLEIAAAERVAGVEPGAEFEVDFFRE